MDRQEMGLGDRAGGISIGDEGVAREMTLST